jgi:hypothetical protein
MIVQRALSKCQKDEIVYLGLNNQQPVGSIGSTQLDRRAQDNPYDME